jgi:hypothetical protein
MSGLAESGTGVRKSVRSKCYFPVARLAGVDASQTVSSSRAIPIPTPMHMVATARWAP